MDKEIIRRLKNILFTTLFLIGSTYVWANNITVQAKTISNSYFNNAYLSISEVSGGVFMENAYPITDEEGMETIGYTFKVDNSANGQISYKLMFISDGENTIDNKFIKYSYNINDGEYTKPQLLSENSTITSDVSGKSSNTYNIKFWIDENATNEIMNKTFSTRIGLESI